MTDILSEIASDTPMESSAGTGKTVEVDGRGLQCPGPLRKLAEAAADARGGDILVATATDPGFLADAQAWCRKLGHEVLEVHQTEDEVRLRIRCACQVVRQAESRSTLKADKLTMVVFSGDLDKVLAGFVIANGAAAMGGEVVMFFTFWGLNALRKPKTPSLAKPLIDRLFGWMMPKGVDALKLSQMNMGGVGTAMMKRVMRQKNVESLRQMMESARKMGVRLVACSMSMDVMGLRREELLDDIEVGGVASFLGESYDAGTTLFI